MNLLLNLKNIIIALLLLTCIGLSLWGKVGWIKYQGCQGNLIIYADDIAKQNKANNDFQNAANKKLKAKEMAAKEWRSDYLFERKELNNVLGIDQALGCESATDSAIERALKMKSRL